ncbi:MAG: DUF748 domain-containing protein [Candidatus Omnitrophota bacterium]
MILRKKILLTGVLIVVLIFAAIHVFIQLRGKALLKDKLERVLKREVVISRLETSFPLNINIRGLEVKGLFRADKVILKAGFFDVFRNRFYLSLLKIEQPVITLEKEALPPELKKQIPVLLNSNLSAQKEDKTLQLPQLNPLLPGLGIHHFIVDNGSINYIDRSIENNELLIKIRNLDLKIDNLNLNIADPQITSFRLKANIPWQDNGEQGKVNVSGWVNLLKKDMQADVKVEGIDGLYLYPYYSQWVNLEKTRIQKVKLNFSSNIYGLDNDITAKCHLELTDIEFKERSSEELQKKEERMAHAVLDIFKAMDQGKIVVDFTIHTKMDKPLFSMVPLKGALENKLASSGKLDKPSVQGVVSLPIKILEGIVKSTADLSKAAIDGTFAVGSELGKSVVASFKKEK